MIIGIEVFSILSSIVINKSKGFNGNRRCLLIEVNRCLLIGVNCLLELRRKRRRRRMKERRRENLVEAVMG